MAVTYESFTLKYSAFSSADEAMVTAHLDQLTALYQGSMSETQRDLLVELSLADTLARLPEARDMQLVAKDDSTVWSRQRDIMIRVAAISRRHVLRG
jgi:ATP-dependent exoDNAse (exonuclease V) alpha subunit